MAPGMHGGKAMRDHDLLEFEKLKDEQIGRLTYRDTLFYFTLVIIGGGLATVYSKAEAAVILLALPFAIFIAGVSHITCDRRIEDIGIYIRDYLTKTVAEKSGTPPEKVFAWEYYFPSTSWHSVRKLLQFVANFLLYAGAGIVSLLLFLNMRKCGVARLPASERCFWWIGMALMVCMAILVLASTFFKWTHRNLSGESACRPRRIVVRLILAGATALAAALAVGFGAHYTGKLLAGWIDLPGWHVASVDAAAAAVAFLAWTLVLTLAKR